MTAIETAVRIVVDLLVRREYDVIERLSRGRRLSAADMQRAVGDYGREIVPPGPGWWDLVHVVPVTGADPPALAVASPLWTREEGRSDLQLELTLVEIAPEVYDTEVDNLHVQ